MLSHPLSWACSGLAFALCLPAICARLLFLAPTRIGAVAYFSNVFRDLAFKRLKLPRWTMELGILGIGVAGLALLEPFGWFDGLAVAAIAVALELIARIRERRILDTAYAHEDCRWQATGNMPVGPYPSPSPHPELTVNLNGPFVRRLPGYDVGDLASGRTVEVEYLIGNHSIVPGQIPTIVTAEGSEAVEVSPLSVEAPPLRSGDVFRGVLQLTAKARHGPGQIRLSIAHGDRTTVLAIRYRSVFEGSQVVKAEITRYPGACRSAFAWRGDMDLYDTSTFQSIEGLTQTLGLAGRYRFPQTMYLSTRLTLDAREAEEFCGHFGVERGQAEIPEFVTWMRQNVGLQHQATYPFESEKPYVLELGNHGHLHYGTDAAAARANNWCRRAKIGAGQYDWLGADPGSFAEQRDNALAARRLCEEQLGFMPKSWAMPDRTRDAFTPAAMEAAGCEVVSDSDVSTRHNVLTQPPPHHPPGTGTVELTKRYPGDPESIFQAAMIEYWIHRAHRKGIPVVLMCHQHMRRSHGHSCARFTEHILRYVLSRFHGDLHINTVYGIGIYWREVFSPTRRAVFVECQDNATVVRNRGACTLMAVPVDVTFQGNRHATILVDLSPGSALRLGADGRIQPEREDAR